MKTITLLALVLFLVSCTKEQRAKSLAQEAVLASSAFHAGETAPTVTVAGGETGNIPTTPTIPGGNDGGVIPPPTPPVTPPVIPPVVTPVPPTLPPPVTPPVVPPVVPPVAPPETNPPLPPVLPPVSHNPSDPLPPCNTPGECGTIPGGNDPGGNDGGEISGLNYTISRVCSVQRSNLPSFVFFEDAAKPILTFEASIPTATSSQLQYLAAPIIGITVNKMTQSTGSTNIILAYQNLNSVDLFNGKFSASLRYSLAEFKRTYPTNWQRSTLSVRVCNDKNNNNKCDAGDDALSVQPVSFSISHVPSVVMVDVWHGRHLTLAHDPQFCEKQYSPLLLDMNNIGFKLTGPEKGVYFDLNAEGYPILTGWTATQNEAFLVRDVNKNGYIDDGGELFGSATLLNNGLRAVNGFEALKELDTNGDYIFDDKDSAYRTIKLWIDVNHNGFSEREEFISLAKAGVRSIDLSYKNVSEVDDFGNQTRQRSTFERSYGARSTKTQMIIDIWFNTLSRY